jgi:hypothetical protein
MSEISKNKRKHKIVVDSSLSVLLKDRLKANNVQVNEDDKISKDDDGEDDEVGTVVYRDKQHNGTMQSVKEMSRLLAQSRSRIVKTLAKKGPAG